ncbi:MAG: M6 family metalloprotease domain-containing protein [Bacteroidales bacterium]|nr:M6 family metalloprotease domain-containing protein [Bacteroidales bacterium]
MKRFDSRLLLFSLLWLTALPLRAVMAYPGAVTVQQPDGKQLTIHIRGDEHFHYVTDASGYLLKQDEAGYYRPAVFTSDGSLRIAEGTRMHYRQIPGKVATTAQMRRAQARDRQTQQRAARVGNYPPKTLVILAAFSDVGFQYADDADARQAFNDMLNKAGYSVNGGTGSVREYYSDNSGGAFVPEFVVVGPYPLPKEMAYYGENNATGDDEPNAPQMAYDAVVAAYNDGVDLTQFDTDHDGRLDNIYIFYAGYGESDGGGANTVWPHAYTLANKGMVGGLKLGEYACSAELEWYTKKMCGIGVFCHEYGHTLGLPDFYDTDYEGSGGECLGLDNLSLMASGCYNNDSRTPPYLTAEELMELGWLQPEPLTAGRWSLPPIAEKKAYIIETANKGEYFLFENRQQEKWDTYLYSHGMIIYHVDKSSNYVDGRKASDLWSSNELNVYPHHQCMYPVRQNEMSITSAFYPSKSGLTEFSPNSNPAAAAWSSVPLDYGLYEITELRGSITFRVKAENEVVYLGGVVTDRSGMPIADALLYLISNESSSQSIRRTGLRRQQAQSYTTLTDADGCYLFRNVPAGDYRLVCQAEGYLRREEALTLSGGSQVRSFVLAVKGDEDFIDQTSWAGNVFQAIGVDDGYFAAAVRWEASDIDWLIGNHVGQVQVSVYSAEKSQMTLKVHYGNRATVTRSVSYEDLADAGDYTFDLLDDTTTLQAGEEVLIEVSFDKGGWLNVDRGPAVKGKGDLYRKSSHGTWLSLYEDTQGEMDCNWCIDANWYRVSEYVPMESFSVLDHQLKLKVGRSHFLLTQFSPSEATATDVEWRSSNPSVAAVDIRGLVTAHSAGMAWIKATTDRGKQQDSCLVTVVPTLASSLTAQAAYHVAALRWAGYGADTWQLRWTDTQGAVSRDTTLSEPWIGMQGLSPSSNYQIYLRALSGGEAVDSISTTLQTLTVATTPAYNALYVNTAAAVRDSLVLLDVKKWPEGAALQWLWDGQVVKAPVVRWADRESHWLEVRILDAQGRNTEMIRRKLVYPNENKQ